MALAGSCAPANAAWYEARSKHFIVYADQNPKDLKSYAEKLERFDQAVRYVRRMSDPPLSDAGRVTIFVLPDLESIGILAGSSAVAGFYKTTAAGSYAFIPRTTHYMVAGAAEGFRTEHAGVSPQEIFFHEYSHHLQLADTNVAMPTWVSEGFAEFFQTADIKKDGSVSIGANPGSWIFSIHDRTSLPVDQMLGATYGDKMYLIQVEALYARGWLLTHYLSMTDGRRGQLQKYLNSIQQGTKPLDAAKDAFGDLKQLDAELNNYANQSSYLGFTVKGDVIPIGDVVLRPLTPGEAAVMHVRIRSKAGVDDSSAGGVAGDARRIAASFPADAVVQSELAEAEFDAKNYAAADSAADRALALDPKEIHALIYKGRAQVKLAKASGKPADWDGIREWFLRANKLDTENPQPLALYYDTFAEAGQQLTQNAIDALLYAVELAPRDQDLRTTAVGVLIVQNKLKDARQMFAPLAYEPHLSSAKRELATKVIAALDAGDGKAALQLLQTKPDDSKKKPGKSA
jgi:tetratricopeptide (TPR) repeat protein